MIVSLFLTFAKIGLFTFGGGYAMISLIESICVEQKKWITHEQMMKITVIAESTPGPIAINCATFVGYKQKGVAGAYGAIPLIRDVVLHYGWMDEENLVNMIAISESTPGPIMVNLG